MSEAEALLLGIVQGLTEFLPISSSGHLILVPWLQDYTFLQEHESFNKTFDVALHIGTLVAVLAYFRVELWRMGHGFVRSVRKREITDIDERMAWVVIIATIPAVIVGGFGVDFIDRELGEPWMIAILLIVFGLVLFHADRQSSHFGIGDMTVKRGFAMGVAQAVSLAPGVSRSGVTISMARYLGFDRDSAARVSFLLLVPATTGAGVLKTVEAINEGFPPGVVGPMIVGTIAATISGYVAIAGLLALVRRRSYDGFAYYRVIVGIGCLLLIALGVRDPTF